MAKPSSYVHVPVNGDWVVYGPDDEVPAEHAALITNPKAWEGGELPTSENESQETGDTDEAPPRAGAGSTRDAWAQFAESHGVHVEDEDKRDDIIAKLADAGVIDE
jgi:hypothetical protein